MRLRRRNTFWRRGSDPAPVGTGPCSARLVYVGLAAAMVLAAAGCSFQSLSARMMRPMLDDIANSLYRQTDLELAKDGLPSFLLIIDGLLESDPYDRQLLLTGAQAYSAYAMAFVEDEDPVRARALYDRGREIGWRALGDAEMERAIREGTFDELNTVTQSGHMRMVRKGDWKLIVDMAGAGQLYNLADDPAELANLYGLPDVASQ